MNYKNLQKMAFCVVVLGCHGWHFATLPLEGWRGLGKVGALLHVARVLPCLAGRRAEDYVLLQGGAFYWRGLCLITLRPRILSKLCIKLRFASMPRSWIARAPLRSKGVKAFFVFSILNFSGW